MRYQTETGEWVISSHGCWLPGVYDSESTAQWAFRFTWDELQALQDEANKRPVRVITRDDLARNRVTER